MKRQNKFTKFTKQAWLRLGPMFLFAGLFFFTNAASANLGGGGQTLGNVATQVTTSFAALARLITASSYVAGMGFALSAILKFKQHKDNPSQIPIGTPIALLFIAAGLIFLPTIFGIAGQTIFGSSATPGGVTGVSS